MDEALRELQRQALTGDADAALRFVYAYSRVDVPPEHPIEVIEHRESYPANGGGGYYVKLHGKRDALMDARGWKVAGELAKEHGFNPDNYTSAGFPSNINYLVSERCYWFHSKEDK
jgi:hypothetical protein